MTKIEALELELAARKMVEGTTVCWTDVIKCDGVKQSYFIFNAHRDQYELALGIIEGKPVWKDSTVFLPNGKSLLASELQKSILFSSCSWTNPKTETIMVEHLLEDVVDMADNGTFCFPRVARACRKALENLK